MSKEIDSEKEDILQEFIDFLLEDYYKVFKNSNNPEAQITPITDEDLISFQPNKTQERKQDHS